MLGLGPAGSAHHLLAHNHHTALKAAPQSSRARSTLSWTSSMPAAGAPCTAASSAPLLVLLRPCHLSHPPLHLLQALQDGHPELVIQRRSSATGRSGWRRAAAAFLLFPRAAPPGRSRQPGRARPAQLRAPQLDRLGLRVPLSPRHSPRAPPGPMAGRGGELTGPGPAPRAAAANPRALRHSEPGRGRCGAEAARRGDCAGTAPSRAAPRWTAAGPALRARAECWLQPLATPPPRCAPRSGRPARGAAAARSRAGRR